MEYSQFTHVRRSCGLAVALLCLTAAPITALAQGQTPEGRRTLTIEQAEQVRPLFTLVEDAAAGKPVPVDFLLTWQYYFVKAESGLVVVPFTVKIEKGQFTSFPLAMYVRVVMRGAPAPAPGPRDALAQYPFEDVAIFEEPMDGRLSRAFSAPAGQYDVYIALREKATLDLPEPRIVVMKQAVDLPDLTSELAVSSIIVADKIDPDPAVSRLRTFEEQLDDPYALWGFRITPTFGGRLSRDRVLSLIFLVYNAGAASDDKPDVQVDYTFHQRARGAEQVFNQLRPQLLNQKTLKPEFSLAQGHIVMAGEDIPLTRFPDGDYRLEITVTDKTSARTLTRNVTFTVAGP